MNVLYDIFYEVLSEEGVWVLVLIASAFAVASFILLTLRMETSPKQGGISGVESKPRKEKSAGADKKKEKEAEETSTEKLPDLPESPEMTPPGSFTHPEIVLPGAAPYKNIPQPLGADTPGETGETAPPASGLVLDPFEVASIPGPDVAMAAPDQAPPPGDDVAPISVSMAEKATPADKVPIVVPIDGAITSTGMAPEQAEDDEESQPSQESENTDIFDLFEGVDEEDTDLAAFAKELDDVALSGLLTETEGLTRELKELFTRH